MWGQARSIFRKLYYALAPAGPWLYSHCGDDLREKIDKTTQFVGSPKVKATVTASAVFMALYLYAGFLIFRLDGWYALIWPYAASFFLRASLFSLAAILGVALYIYRLKLNALLQSGDKVRELEEQLELQRVHSRTLDKRNQDEIHELYTHLEAAKAATRRALEEKKQAESRAADAEAKARGAHNPGPAGKDEKFSEARRAFARLYHPDNVKGGGLDKIIRAEIFKEYWSELEKIEKGGKK